MKVVLLSRDLMFISRVKEVAAARNQQAVIAKNEQSLHEALATTTPLERGVLLLDLEKLPVAIDTLERVVAALDPQVWRCVSFYSHVHADTAADAKRRGLGDVMPRSKFVQLLPQLFESPP